jgi:hypothetical protein
MFEMGFDVLNHGVLLSIFLSEPKNLYFGGPLARVTLSSPICPFLILRSSRRFVDSIKTVRSKAFPDLKGI